MKVKIFLLVFCLGLITTSTISCREKSTTEKVADDVEDAIDDVEDAID